MNVNNTTDNKNRDCARIELDPPTFSPPPEMRARYLEKRKAELDDLIDHARNGEWKPVMTVAGHVRGTGAMYGFENIGTAAENLVKAVQNGDAKSIEFMEKYAEAVNASYV
jgi:hypothetical protein